VFLGLFQLPPNFVNTQKLPDWGSAARREREMHWDNIR
jgi:hypothetical protein